VLDKCHIWLREEGIELPVKSAPRRGARRRVATAGLQHRAQHPDAIRSIQVPTRSGASTSRVSVKGGRKHISGVVCKSPWRNGNVLIKDHHTAYITWDEFEHNLEVIANNATGMSSALARGAARKGELLLPGLLRCGHCGASIHVHYSGKIGRYNCYGALTNHGARAGISISGLSIDAAISNEVTARAEAARHRSRTQSDQGAIEHDDRGRAPLELFTLQAARYGAAHARRQYDAVRPGKPAGRRELEPPLERACGLSQSLKERSPP